MGDYEVLELPDFVLQRGGMLPAAKLVYKTLGTLSPTRDNVVLVPTWYTGTHNDIETFMTGEGRALDPRKYFIVMTNLLGHGLFSSPSNSRAPFERGRFPKVTIYDNVRLQHLLLTQKLDIARIRLVTGWSMGACQAFQWAAQFPDMVRAACARATTRSTWLISGSRSFYAAMRTTCSRSSGPGCMATSVTIPSIAATLRPLSARSRRAPSSCRWTTTRYFPPADSEYEARHIPGAKCRVISSIWGHMAPMNPQDIPAIDSALHELLAN
jgi:pimeloyl-ACP methyl ester carboxylesterase